MERGGGSLPAALWGEVLTPLIAPLLPLTSRFKDTWLPPALQTRRKTLPQRIFDPTVWLAGQPPRVSVSPKRDDETKLIPALFRLVRKERVNYFLESMQHGWAELSKLIVSCCWAAWAVLALKTSPGPFQTELSYDYYMHQLLQKFLAHFIHLFCYRFYIQRWNRTEESWNFRQVMRDFHQVLYISWHPEPQEHPADCGCSSACASF